MHSLNGYLSRARYVSGTEWAVEWANVGYISELKEQRRQGKTDHQ